MSNYVIVRHCGVLFYWAASYDDELHCSN